MNIFMPGVIKRQLDLTPNFAAPSPPPPPAAPAWSLPPTFTVQEGATGTFNLPVSVAGGGVITLAWVGPGSKPAWVTLNNGATPSISFSGAQVDANDITGMVIAATANGQTTNSAAGSITVYSGGTTSTPFTVWRSGVQVGPAYGTLHEAIYFTAQSGDTIKIAPGTYIINSASPGSPGSIYFDSTKPYASAKWSPVDGIQFNTLTIEGADPNNPTVIDCSPYCQIQAGNGGSPDGIVMGTGCYYLTVRHLRLKGFLSTDNSGGIRSKSGYYTTPPDGNGLESILTVENCKIESFTNGIISTNNHNQKYFIRKSVFENNSGRDQAHGIYMGHSDTIEVDGCRFVNSEVVAFSRGHLFKSRAKHTRIRASVLDSGTGCARLMDISNGGDLEVAGCVLIHRGGGNPLGAFQGQQDNQICAFGPEQTIGYYGAGEFAADGRTHSVKWWQNTTRKTEGHRTGDPPQAFQTLRIWPGILTDAGTPATIVQTDGSGSTVRNNIAASDTVGSGNSAQEFVTLWPSNTAVAHTTVADDGAYSGGDIVGNPAVNDAHTAFKANYQDPVARSDTYRGGRVVNPISLTALGSIAAGLGVGQSIRIIGSNPLTSAHMQYGSDGANFIMWGQSMYFDPTRKEVGFIGKRNSNSYAYHWLVYDIVNDSWSNTRPVWSTALLFGHGYDHTACDPSTGTIYHRPYGDTNVYVWNGSWSTLGASLTGATIAGGLAWWPGKGLFYGDSGTAKLYSGGAWQTLGSNFASSYHEFAEYNASAGVMVFGAGNSCPMMRVNSNLTITNPLTAPPFGVGSGTGLVVSDPTSDNLLAYHLASGAASAYDISANTWTTIARSTGSGSTPQNGFPNFSIDSNYQVIGCPIPDLGVTMWVQWLGGNNSSDIRLGGVWLYRHS